MSAFCPGLRKLTQLDACEFYTMKSGKVRLHKEKTLSRSNQTKQTHKQKVTEKGDKIQVLSNSGLPRDALLSGHWDSFGLASPQEGGGDLLKASKSLALEGIDVAGH